MGTLIRGLAAGAAGVTALNATTYLDMLLTGRPESDVPARAIQGLLDRSGTSVPGGRQERDHRQSALAALGGIGTGLTVGVAASLVRRAGVRLPAPLGAAAIGAAAMAAGDLPPARLGVTDPRTWSGRDWAADVVPHLAFGVAVRLVLDRTASREEVRRAEARTRRDVARQQRRERRRAHARVVGRSALLGLATGCRSSLGLAAPLLLASGRRGSPRTVTLGSPARRSSSRTTATRLAGAGVVGVELLADKLPTTPSRLEPQALLPRYAAGATGAALLARREQTGAVLPVLAGALGTTAASVGGLAWREHAAQRGWTPRGQLGAALAEDAVALALATAAARS